VAPGFSDAVFEHVWRTTVEIYFEMARSEKWDQLDVGGMSEVPNVPELMSKVSIRTGMMRFLWFSRLILEVFYGFQMALTVLGKRELGVSYATTNRLIYLYGS
jgi:hypothetical protein